MSSLMWMVAGLVALVGALEWAQDAPALGALLMLVSIGLAPLHARDSAGGEAA